MQTLLIEDDAASRLVLEKQLEALGHHVTACDDAETGLDRYQQAFYPLVVTDLDLPGMSGIGFTQRIRALPQGEMSMILLVTGHDQPEDLSKALEAGVDDYARKPLQTEQLRVRLNIIERRRENLRQRQEAQEGLQIFKAIIESSHEAITISDSSGKLMYINPAYEELFGRAFDAARHTNYRDYYPPEHIKFIENRLIPVLLRGESWEGELDVIDSQGRRFPIWKRIDAVRDESGKVLYGFGMMHDITERRRIEEGLRRLQKAVETIRVGVTISDIHGKILYTNPAEARMHGYVSVEELIGKDVGIFAPHELRCPLNLERLDQKPHWDRSSVNVRRDKSQFPVRLISDVVRDSMGNPVAIVTICEDISEQQQAERALQESEERFRKTFEQAAVGIAHVATGGEFLRVNQRFCDIVGYRREEMLRLTFQKITYPDDLPKDFEAVQQFMDGSIQAYSMEKRYIHKNGDLVWINLTVSLVREFEGGAKYFIAVIEDISQRKQAEEALKMSAQQYRLLAENVADGIGIIQNERLVFVNLALAAMLGYEPNQLFGKSPEEIFQGEYSTYFHRTPEQVLEGLTTPYWQMLEIVVSGENREIWMEGQHSSILWQGKPATLVTLRDISDRKQQEQEMAEERTQLQQEISQLRSSIKERDRFGDLIGHSSAMQAVYDTIVKAADTDAGVVIYGESGSGKDVVAQTIHRLSARKNGNFVPVNCGSIPENLMESEFFGYHKGAFTGAYRDKPGLFDAAHEGTLFLDEIGELELSMQVKLLRAVEGKGYTPVGGHAVKHADIRIIAATHKNLRMLLQQGAMRKDFFYRIHVITITVPPLRDRREDIPLLVDHFLEQFGSSSRFQDLPKSIVGSLLAYDWPGNIRELQNALHQYLTLQRVDFLHPHPPEMLKDVHENEENIDGLSFRQAVEQFEKHVIQRALERHHWHRTKTADALALPRKTLFRKIKQYKLE